MNSNRGQYNDSPLYNLKSGKPKKAKQPQAPQQPGAQAPQQSQNPGETAQPLQRHGLLSVILSLGLPILFVLALVIPSDGLRWAFLGVTGASVLAMWALGAFVRSARNTLTVVYVALGVVIGLALFINQQAPEARPAAAARVTATAAPQQEGLMQSLATSDPAAPTASPEDDLSQAERRWNEFFQAWKDRLVQEMQKYCSPAWINVTKSPDTALFMMISGSVPMEYTRESISGSDGNNTRILTVKVLFEENGETVLKRLNVILVKVNEVWYVNPDSLDGVVVDEEAERKASAQSYAVINTTKAPTPTEDPNKEVVYVYYNPEGGKYYHAIRSCSAVSNQYWPLTKLPLEMLNSQEFKNLQRCTTCNPPERPTVTQ